VLILFATEIYIYYTITGFSPRMVIFTNANEEISLNIVKGVMNLIQTF